MAKSTEILTQKISDISDFVDKGGYSKPQLQKKLGESSVDLLNIAGHDREHIFADLSFRTPERVRREFGHEIIHFPAVAAHDPASPPYVAVTVATNLGRLTVPDEPSDLDGRAARYLMACDVTSRAEYTVLLTKSYISILGKEYPPKGYPLSRFSEEDAEELIESLSPPEDYPQGIGAKFPPGHHPNQTKLTHWIFADSEKVPDYHRSIETDFFSINVGEYRDILYEAYTAEDPQNKGDTLEDVAEHLFQGLSMIDVRDTNLRTRSGEIDLVLEYTGADRANIFDYQSRFALVECKNVSGSVSSKEVAHFCEKLRSTDTNLGFVIAWNGISGEESGNDAQRYVDTSSPNTYVVVMTSDDLYRILDGESLYDIIDEKLYELRFDLK